MPIYQVCIFYSLTIIAHAPSSVFQIRAEVPHVRSREGHQPGGENDPHSSSSEQSARQGPDGRERKTETSRVRNFHIREADAPKKASPNKKSESPGGSMPPARHAPLMKGPRGLAVEALRKVAISNNSISNRKQCMVLGPLSGGIVPLFFSFPLDRFVHKKS